MVTVAVVAATLAAERLARRRAFYLERVEVWEDRVNELVVGPMPCLREEYDTPEMIAKMVKYRRGMARKYRAAARLWLPVPPDPPPPE